MFSRRREARKSIFSEKSGKTFGGSRNYAYLCNVKIINAAEEKPLSNRSAFFMPATFKEQQSNCTASGYGNAPEVSALMSLDSA